MKPSILSRASTAVGFVAASPLRSSFLRALGLAHGRIVHSRRVRALATAIAPLIPTGSRVLDIGCGDGTLASLVRDQCPGASIEGFEIAPRPQTMIPLATFDGSTIPAEDQSADIVMLVDVLHHTADPMILMREVARVARQAVVIKDHRMSCFGAGAKLRFMDWVGNRPHGVVLPYNYWTEERWRAAWDELGLKVEHYQTELGLYPKPACWLFETGLHFLAKLSISESKPDLLKDSR